MKKGGVQFRILYLVSSVYCLFFAVGCEKSFDFSAPEVRFISPQDGETVHQKILLLHLRPVFLVLAVGQ